MTLGELMYRARTKLRLTQKEIANLMAISQGTYSRLERNLQNPTLYQMMQIRIHLHISLDKFFDNIPTKNRMV